MTALVALLVESGPWLLDTLIASALLMAVVLLIRRGVRRAFGPRVTYALWALPVLRIILPPLPVGWWRGAEAVPIRQAGETIVLVIAPAHAATGPALGALLAALWAAGALAFLAVHLVRHHHFTRGVLRDAEPIASHHGVTVVASGVVTGPVAFGLWRRYVAFPRDLDERYDADERALALAHELGHHARGDLHANWTALVVLALHWFDPLAWRAFHAFRADQELANDARVLAGCGGEARHAYARAIVKAASPDLAGPAFTGRAIAATCHLHTIADLKGRLRMLTTSQTSRRRMYAGTVAVGMMTLGGLALTASGSAAARMSDRVGVVLQATPATPATPPVPPADPRQARTIVVSPDRDRATVLIVRRAAVAPGAPLPPDVRLPKNFELPPSCAAGQGGPARVIKGEDGDQSYTILCATAPGPDAVGTTERGAYRQALASLHIVRGQIATQVTPAFPDADRRDALAAVDRSIAEIEADLAALR